MILGNTSLEIGEEETGFLAVQSVVLYTFYFISVYCYYFQRCN